MDRELVEFCRVRAKTDAGYAIAYALLIGRVVKNQGFADYVPRKGEHRPRVEEQGLSKTISKWIDDEDVGEFCLRDVWIWCLGNDVNTYTENEARMLGRAVKLLPNVVSVGPRRHEEHGPQKFFRVLAATSKPVDDPLDDLDL